MRRFSAVMSAAFLLSVFVFAAYSGEKKSLAGNVSGDLPRGEYFVSSAITVRQGERLVIPAGSALYFEQLTGITVYGELIINGEEGAAVILTSAADTCDADGDALGIDWNGIEATGPGAALRLRHARIANSVYGVNVKDFGAYADLAGVVFHNNAYATFMIGGREVPVAPGKPVDVLWDMGPRSPRPLLADTSSSSNGNDTPGSNRRAVMRVGAMGLAVAGTIFSGVKALSARNDFHKYVWEEDFTRRAAIRDRAYKDATAGAIGAAIAGAGLACVAATIFF